MKKVKPGSLPCKNKRLSFKFFLFALLALFCWQCRDKLDPLEFTEVAMPDKPQRISLDSIRLQAQISGTADAVGFIWSEDPNVLLAPQGGGFQTLPVTAPSAGTANFETIFKALPGKIYYFRGFAQLGARRVYSPQLQLYSIDLQLSVQYISRNNDRAVLAGQIIGLETTGLKVAAHGHVFSSSNPLPEVGAPGCDTTNLGATNDDATFLSQLSNLAFNTRYYARAYATLSSGSKIYSKETLQFDIKDGWKRLNPMPVPYKDGLAIADEALGKAFIGFGCQRADLICDLNELNPAFRSFDPAPNNGLGQWNSEKSFAGQLLRVNATAFLIKDNVYTIFGEYNEAGLSGSFFVRDFKKFSTSTGSWTKGKDTTITKRGEAVAFVLNGKAYVGSGRIADNDSEVNDFWEYNPDNEQWRKVASLPLQLKPSGPVLYSAGRREAVAFSLGDKGYVGGGAYLATYLNDFWQFTPPSNMQDTGKWELVNFFPGLARVDAVAFSIGNKAYYGTGYNINAGELDDFWEFDPATRLWRSRTPFEGGRRQRGLGFALGGFGYLGTGLEKRIINNGNDVEYLIYSDLWKYYPEKM